MQVLNQIIVNTTNAGIPASLSQGVIVGLIGLIGMNGELSGRQRVVANLWCKPISCASPNGGPWALLDGDLAP